MNKENLLNLALALSILLLLFVLIVFVNNVDFADTNTLITIFTAVYVFGTLLMWWEMRRTRMYSRKPKIQVFLKPVKVPRAGHDLFFLVVENVGSVPIYDLNLNFNPSGMKSSFGRNVDDLFNGYFLGVGQSTEILLFRSKHFKKINVFSIVASFRSFLDNESEIKKFKFKYDDFNLVGMPYKANLNHIRSELDKISNGIGYINNNLSEIKDVLDDNDIKPLT